MNNEHDSIIYSTNSSDCQIVVKSTSNNFDFSLYYWYEGNVNKFIIFMNLVLEV